MQRKKILWLVSWYPNKNDRFDGDFIQRHARAAAIYHDVHVIFVTEADIESDTEEEVNYVTGLTEQVIYVRKTGGILSRIRKQWKWKNSFQKAVQKYVLKNGLPSKLHVHVPWKAGLIALWMKKEYGTSFVATEHWGIYDNSSDDGFARKPVLTRNLLKQIYREAETVVTVSKFLAGTVQSETGRVADLIIPNVVDTTLFFYKEEKYSKFTFIHVSNMVPLKNADLILASFKEALERSDAEMQLIMIGNRDDAYIKLAGSMGLLNTSVFFRGEIAYADVAEEMRHSHGMVIFSDSETFSCVTAEALCCGLPVVASLAGALPELVDQTNGILVPLKDKAALVEAMLTVRQSYAAFDHKGISEAAAKKYGYSAVAGLFDAVYQEKI